MGKGESCELRKIYGWNVRQFNQVVHHIPSSSSSNNSQCMVLAILFHVSSLELVFCTSADTEWTLLSNDCKPCDDFHVVFYKGQFYGVCGIQIYVCNTNRGLVRIPSDVADYKLNAWVRTREVRSYLVKSTTSDLLLVLSKRRRFVKEPHKYCHQVYKVDLGEHPVKLVQMRSGLGDDALFLDTTGQVFSVSARLTGCRQNCIYIAGDSESHVRVYSLEDRSSELIFIPDVDHPDRRPVGWIAPNLLSSN